MTTETTLKDRTIEMTVTPVLNYPSPGNYGATFTVTQTGGDPQSMRGRVDRNGNIRLKNMPTDANYNDNVDVTILLDASQLKDEHGAPLAGRWALSNEWSGVGPVTGFCWFCAVDANGHYQTDQPITVANMSTSRISDLEILIDDDTPDSAPDYAFCLGLVLPEKSNYYLTLDPIIGSKTGIGNPPA